MTDKGLRGLARMYIYHHTGAEAGAILFDNRGNAELPSDWEENYFLIFSHQFFFLVMSFWRLVWFLLSHLLDPVLCKFS